MNNLRPIWLGVLAVVLLVSAWSVQTFLAVTYPGLDPLVYCLYGVAVPVLLGMLLDGWLQVRERATDIFQARQRALAITSMGQLLEAAKGVHPEVLNQLFRDRARRWGLVSGTKSRDKSPYSVLIARPQVTDRFLAHVLKVSNETTIMSKRMLSDGDKRFDPQGIVTAYEMYDALHSLLEAEMKLTRPYGPNKPGYWLNDWTPESVAADFGLNLDDYEYGVTVSDLGQTPENVQAALRDLTPLANQ
jgi:hypothetical protein